MIKTESATVYCGGGRRWFTLNAAARAEAKRKIKERCDCDSGDRDTPPVVCYYHAEAYPEVIRRLAYKYKAQFKAAQAVN